MGIETKATPPAAQIVPASPTLPPQASAATLLVQLPAPKGTPRTEVATPPAEAGAATPPSTERKSLREERREEREKRREGRKAGDGEERRPGERLGGFLEKLQSSGVGAQFAQLIGTQLGGDPKQTHEAVRVLFKDARELSSAKSGLDKVIQAARVDSDIRKVEEAAPGTISGIAALTKATATLTAALPKSQNEQLKPFATLVQTDSRNLAAVTATYEKYAEARKKQDLPAIITTATELKTAIDTFQTQHDKLLKDSRLGPLLKLFSETVPAQPQLPKR